MNRSQSFDEGMEQLLKEAELFRRGDELLDKVRALKRRLLNRLRLSKALRADTDQVEEKSIHRS